MTARPSTTLLHPATSTRAARVARTPILRFMAPHAAMDSHRPWQGPGLRSPLARLRCSGATQWRLLSGVYSVASTQWRLLSGFYSVASAQWRLLSGVYSVASTQWRLLSGVYSVASTQWRLLS